MFEERSEQEATIRHTKTKPHPLQSSRCKFLPPSYFYSVSYKKKNRAAWDQLASSRTRFARCATDEELENPLSVLDGRGWLPASIQGMDVLCLASGGGWQSILYAAAGANVTVVDISPEMLKLDQQEADRRGFQVETIETSMDDLSAVPDSRFDIVHQPVSSCYIPSLEPMYAEIARVIRDDGIYISQHKQPTSMQIVDRDQKDRYIIGVEYYRDGPLPKVADTSYREDGAMEFLHRWEEIVGNLCRSGFHIEDLREPLRGDKTALPGDFRHRGCFVPPYVRMKARRKKRAEISSAKSPSLWTP